MMYDLCFMFNVLCLLFAVVCFMFHVLGWLLDVECLSSMFADLRPCRRRTI